MKGRYYWLKLQNNFFERPEIKMILALPNGTKYVVIYLKILLKSIETEGVLIFKESMPYTPEMIAFITDEDIDLVRSAIKVFVGFKLMDTLDNGALFMNEFENMVGSESKWAEIKRNQRKGQNESTDADNDNEKELIGNPMIENSENNAMDNVHRMSKKSPIEKESDSELKKKKNKVYMNLTFIDDIIENVKITEEEYNKLIGKHGKANIDKIILKLDNYIANGRKKYKDHYRVINTWSISNAKHNEKFLRGTNNKTYVIDNNINKSHDMFVFD